jgi:cobalt/nickel transport system permease protein
MPSLAVAVMELKRLDLLALGDSSLHRLDPRALLLATLLFVVTVASWGRHEVLRLLPLALFPAALVAGGRLPGWFLLRKASLALPFALLVCLANPLLDRAPLLRLGDFAISGGWLSLISVLLKTLLTVSSALALVSLAGLPRLGGALEALRVPRPFVTQLLLLYRYLFLLAEEALRGQRARSLRDPDQRGSGMGFHSSLLGHLLLRTWQRGERIQAAMLCRGLDGSLPGAPGGIFGMREILFLVCWGLFFLLARLLPGAESWGM